MEARNGNRRVNPRTRRSLNGSLELVDAPSAPAAALLSQSDVMRLVRQPVLGHM